MAKQLKNIFSGTDKVQQNFTVQSWHVSQSVDALTGTEAYDLTISGSLTMTGSIIFDTTVEEGNHVPGRLQWDTTDQTLKLDLATSGSSLQIGQEFHVYARNESGVTINNGEAVRIVGTTGTKVTIEKAISQIQTFNSTDQNEIIGLATQEIPNNNFGYITLFGAVRDINTSTLTEGEICYVSHITSGSLTNSKPPAPYSIIIVGIVERSNTNTGQILVKPVDPIHMHDITGVTGSNIPTGTSYWSYDSTTGITSLSNQLSGSFSGSFVGSFEGDGSGLTGVTSSSGPNFANTNLTQSEARIYKTDNNSLLISSTGDTNTTVTGSGQYLHFPSPIDVMGTSITQSLFGVNDSYIEIYHDVTAGLSYNEIYTNGTSSFQHTGLGAIGFNSSLNNSYLTILGNTNSNLFYADLVSESIGVGTNTPSFKLDVLGSTNLSGSVHFNTRHIGEVAADLFVTNTDYICFYSASQAGAGDINLPSSPNVGQSLSLIRISGSLAFDIRAGGGLTINDGSTTKALPTALYSRVNLVYDGNQWWASQESAL